ncbi:unnamed protein product [Spodoptera exigua]|nr:unnamed protein product [Spodoptera exigua]
MPTSIVVIGDDFIRMRPRTCPTTLANDPKPATSRADGNNESERGQECRRGCGQVRGAGAQVPGSQARNASTSNKAYPPPFTPRPPRAASAVTLCLPKNSMDRTQGTPAEADRLAQPANNNNTTKHLIAQTVGRVAWCRGLCGGARALISSVAGHQSLIRCQTRRPPRRSLLAALHTLPLTK